MKIIIQALTVLVLSTSIYAKNDSPSASNSQAKVSEKVAEKTSSVIKEATSAMEDSKKAFIALNDKNKKEAMKSLASAIGKLELVVTRKPELGLVPFDVNLKTNALIGDVKVINKMKEQAIKALQEGRVQEARNILSQLRSDTVISVANLPLGTYPAALKEASRLIDQDKLDKAKEVITSALGTVVINETLIPLPLVRADLFTSEAATLSQKKNRTKEENARLTSLIQESRNSLQMAEALGYVGKNEFSELYSKLDTAAADAKAGKSGSDWFRPVQDKLSQYFVNGNTDKQAEESQD